MPDITVQEIITAANQVINTAKTYTDGMNVSLEEEPIAGSSTTQLSLPIDVSKTEFFTIQATVNCTVKTNDSGTPDDTLVLLAGEAYTWHTTSLHAFKLTVDVVDIYVVVAGATAGTISAEAIINPAL